MRLDRFEGFLAETATCPFVALNEQDEQWVVKAHRDPPGAETLFNEYVAGCLAQQIELPWPRTSLVELSSAVMRRLKREDFQVLSAWAVGSKFLPNLRPLLGPECEWGLSGEFRKRNREYIRSVFKDQAAYPAFYGKAVFENWLLFLEDTKYDTLFMDVEGKPIFLDASHAFGGPKWDGSCLKWDAHQIEIRSPYLRGVVTEANEFDPWLRKIESVSSSDIKDILDAAPGEWEVPTDYTSATCQFLLKTQTDFVPKFRDWANWPNHLLE